MPELIERLPRSHPRNELAHAGLETIRVAIPVLNDSRYMISSGT